jgi:hypothetical protein
MECGSVGVRGLVLGVAAALAACDDGGATGEGGSAGDTEVPIAVDCSFSFAGVQTDVTYTVSDERTDTAVGGKLIASGMLSDPEYESRTFSLTIFAEDSSVGATAIYQMSRTQLPANEFHGDHGFTGLNWVKDPDADESVQYACFARDPADPAHAWEN